MGEPLTLYNPVKGGHIWHSLASLLVDDYYLLNFFKEHNGFLGFFTQEFPQQECQPV